MAAVFGGRFEPVPVAGFIRTTLPDWPECTEMTPPDVQIYLVRLASYRIGESIPAPQFTVVAGPTGPGKAAGQARRAIATRHVLRRTFWEQLLASAKSEGLTTHSGISPSFQNWISAGTGKGGLTLNFVIWMHGAAVELYIDTGDGERNKQVFDKFFASRSKIETAFGGTLEWQRADEKRFCRIRARVSDNGLQDGEDKWPSVQSAMIDGMRRLSVALQPVIHGI